MRNICKKYWFHVVFAIAILAGALFAHWSYETIVRGWSPTMIVDTSVTSDVNPLGYEPVELTGIPVSQGVEKIVTCRVPISYEQYIHYPKNWDTSPFNPKGSIGQFTKLVLYAVLVIVVSLLTWRIAYILKIRKNRRNIKK